MTSDDLLTIGGHDLLGRELYSIADAARITRIPESTVRWWCRGRGHHDPAIRDRLHADLDVRWGDLLSLFFLAQLREHGVDLDSIRDYVDRMQRESEDLYPLARKAVYVNGSKVAWHAADGFEDTTGHVFDEDVFVQPFLKRVEFDSDGIALTLTPSLRHPNVVCHPLVRFGAPQIEGFSTGPLADVVIADFAAATRVGEGVERAAIEREIARDYDMPVSHLREAVAFETEYMQRVRAAA